ncbi:MAG: GNAT family N-acetyltransferase [Anaerolineae bacterium]|nr:GNAT family N-acetyltransferase [Anaerolineae bacterium]
MPDYTIAYLADHPTHIETLAQWHHRQFSYLDADLSVAQRASRLRTHGRGEAPTTVIALFGENVLGSASLTATDMDTRPHLSPWLASVYVDPAYRRRGIGSALVGRIVMLARALGHPALYLFTPDMERFYARLGWRVLEHTCYRGYAQVVMSIDLTA